MIGKEYSPSDGIGLNVYNASKTKANHKTQKPLHGVWIVPLIGLAFVFWGTVIYAAMT